MSHGDENHVIMNPRLRCAPRERVQGGGTLLRPGGGWLGIWQLYRVEGSEQG